MKKGLLRLTAILLLSCPLFAQANADKATQMVQKASDYFDANGKDATLSEISNAQGQFVDGEVYVFAYDLDAVMLAHPKNAKLVGKNLMDVPDVDGKMFRKDIVDTAKNQNTGWIDYKYKNPDSGKIENKTTYVMLKGDIILCCGIYKE